MDIVERLRAYKLQPGWTTPLDGVIQEAADEIERLRKQCELWEFKNRCAIQEMTHDLNVFCDEVERLSAELGRDKPPT